MGHFGTTVLGFLGGSIFSVTLRLTEGRRRFEELSVPRFTGWGAVGGFVLGLVAIGLGFIGAGFEWSLLGRDALIVATTTLLGASSAAGTLAIARRSPVGELRVGDDPSAERALEAP